MKKIKKVLCTGGILLASTALMAGCNNDDNANNSTHDIKIINNSEGFIASSLTSASKDQEIKIKAIANEGYQVKGIYLDGKVCKLDENNNCTFTMEDKDVIVTGEFDLIDYPVDLDFNESEVDVTVNKEVINHDEELVISVNPKAGCLVDKVIVEGETLTGVDNKYTYKIKDINLDKHISVKVSCIRQYHPNLITMSEANVKVSFDKPNYFKGELATLTVKSSNKPIRGFISLNCPEIVFIKDNDNTYHFTIPGGDESVIDITPVYTTGYVVNIKDSKDYVATFDKTTYQENEYGIITFTNKNNKYVSKVTSTNYPDLEITQIDEKKFMFKTPSDVTNLTAIEFKAECLNYIDISSGHNDITLLNLKDHYKAGERVIFKTNNTSSETIKEVFIRDHKDITLNKVGNNEYSFVIPENINNALVVDYVFRNINDEQYNLIIDGVDASLTKPVKFIPGSEAEFSLNIPMDQYVKEFKTNLDVELVKDNTYKVSIPKYVNSDIHITPVLSKYFTVSKTEESKVFTTDKTTYKGNETGYIYVNSDNAIITSKNYPNLKFTKVGNGLYSFVVPNDYNNEIDLTVINDDNDKEISIVGNEYGVIKYDHRKYAPYEYVDVVIIPNEGYGFAINLDDASKIIDKGNNTYSIKASDAPNCIFVDFVEAHKVDVSFDGANVAYYKIKEVNSSIFIRMPKNSYDPGYNVIEVTALKDTCISAITVNGQPYHIENTHNPIIELGGYGENLNVKITTAQTVDTRIMTPKGEEYREIPIGTTINLTDLFQEYRNSITNPDEEKVDDYYYVNGEKYEQSTLKVDRNTTIELRSKFLFHINTIDNPTKNIYVYPNQEIYLPGLPDCLPAPGKELDYYEINGKKYYNRMYQVPSRVDAPISISLFYKDSKITIVEDEHGKISIEKINDSDEYTVHISSDQGYHYVENSITIYDETTHSYQYIAKDNSTFIPKGKNIVLKGIFVKDENIEPLGNGTYVLEEANLATDLNNNVCSALNNGISVCANNVAKFNIQNKTITSVSLSSEKITNNGDPLLLKNAKYELYKDVNYLIENNRIMMPDSVSSDIKMYIINENKIVVYDSIRGNYFTYKYVEDHAPLKEGTYNVEVVRDGKLHFYGLTIKDNMITVPKALNPNLEGFKDLRFVYNIYGNVINLDDSIIGVLADTDYGFIIKNSINRKDIDAFYDNGDIEFIEDYRVIVDSRIHHGSISVDKPLAKPGELVKVNIAPDEGYYYENNSIAIKYKDHISTIDINNPYFVMPKDSDVVLYGVFRPFNQVQFKEGTYSLEFNTDLNFAPYGKYTNKDIKANKSNPTYITIKPNSLAGFSMCYQYSKDNEVYSIIMNDLEFTMHDNMIFISFVDNNRVTYEYAAYLIDENHFAVKDDNTYMVFKYQEDLKLKEKQSYQVFVNKE